MATNAAMVLAKPAGLKPREIAASLAGRLATDRRVDSAEVAGPGFINLTLAPGVWHAVLRSALEAGRGFGRSDLGAGRRVNVEYVSANPTGPLHVGHTRGAVYGDALASLLDFTGHDVTRELLRQRWRGAGRHARPLRPPALPGGAGSRGRLRGRHLSRRLPRARRPRAGRAGGRRLGRRARGGVAGRDARLRHRGDDGADPRRPRRARRRDGRLLLGALALRHRANRGGDRPPARARADLRGHAGPAEGQGARGLGAAAPDALPLHRARRRRGSADRQVRRVVDLLRARHRLSLRQDRPRLRRARRRLRRRSRRLRQADAGGRLGAVGRAGAARRQADADRAPAARRGARPDVQARRGVRHPARSDRGGRARASCASSC